MKKSRFSVEQITYALKQVDTGVPVAEICRKLGISEQTFYVWKKKYGGMGAVEARRVSQLEDENRRLKQFGRGPHAGQAHAPGGPGKRGLRPSLLRERAVAGQPVRRELAEGLQHGRPPAVDVQLQGSTN